MKLAQRFVRPLARLRERVGVRETGRASFIIMGGIIAMPVRQVINRSWRRKYGVSTDWAVHVGENNQLNCNNVFAVFDFLNIF